MQTNPTLRKLSVPGLVILALILLSLILLHFRGSLQGFQHGSRISEELPHPFDFGGAGRGPGSLTFDGPFPQVPAEMMVYKVVHPNVTETYVRELAQKYFDMPPDATLRRSRRLGLYWLETPDARLEVHPTNGSFNIRTTKTPDSQLVGPQKYPSKEDCINIVMEYLKKHDLLPNDAYLREFSDAVNGRTNVRVWFDREIDGYKTWGAGARLIVDIGPGGQLFKLRKSWQQLAPYKTWPIKSPEQAFRDLQDGKGMLDWPDGKVGKITLVYYTSPTRQDYVQPLYYFEFTGPGGPVSKFTGLVPAIKQRYLTSQEQSMKELEERLNNIKK